MKVGRWSELKKSRKKCLSSCTRQENPVELSYYKFPNKMFLNSEDVLPLIKKLSVLCNTSILMYGPKRPLLDAHYPNLCPLFDLIDARMNTESGVHEFYQSIDLNDTTLIAFKREVMTYAAENLIKINAFLDSPYLTKYMTDEVFFRYFYPFIDSIPGDDNYDFHCKHWRNAWTLYGILLCQPC